MAETTKKAAAKKSTSSGNDQSNDQRDPARDEAVNPQGNSGPGTGQEAPAEQTARMPAETVNTDPDAAPLDPPADSHTQTEPEHGVNESSTDHTYAAAGGRTIAGETHGKLVDDNGRKVSSGSLFEDPDSIKTFVVAKKRVYETFTYPNTTREARRLLFTEGQRVPRAQAEAIKARADQGV